MDFKSIYIYALRERQPKLFRELVKTKKLDEHLQEKSLEAHRLLADLITSEPKGPDGLPRDLQALRLAEERVMAQMLEFPGPED